MCASTSFMPLVKGKLPTSILASVLLVISITGLAFAGTFDHAAELPRVTVQTALSSTPAPGAIHLSAGGNLQQAVNSANCGDTIYLQAGAIFNGNVFLPAKNCDNAHWIIIRTSAPDSALPAQGTRLTPCYAGVSSLPGRPALNCKSTAKVTAQVRAFNSGGTFIFNPGANHYRFIGLEISRLPYSNQIPVVYQLVQANGTADHIIFDRVWMHGNPHDDTGRGVRLNGMTTTAVIDSYFSDFHCEAVAGACTDSQAISGGNGSLAGGPYRIHNNFLESSAENILFGGGPGNAVPSDIEITQNHFFKPLIWKPGQPGFVGGRTGKPFTVKNLLELKNAQRVLVEGNIMENTWGGFSQAGYGVLLTPRGSWAPVQDITIRLNRISHVGGGMQLSATRNLENGVWVDSLAAQRWSIHDDVIDDISAARYVGSGIVFLITTGFTSHLFNNMSINHVTAFADPNHGIISLGGRTDIPKASNMNLDNNLMLAGEFPVWSTGLALGCALSGRPLLSFNACWSAYTFTGNGLIGASSTPAWPNGNMFPAGVASVQFVNYNNANGGDYHLQANSPYKGAGTDGKDLGADINALNAAIAGVY